MGLLLCLVWGCKKTENVYVPPPPPEVTVSPPAVQPLTEYLELTGNTVAIDKVELRARVPGFLAKIGFKDGDVVDKGATLFIIEPEPYEAKVNLSVANVASAEAKLMRADQEYKRQQQLIKEKATSQSEVEKWRAQRDAAQAGLDEARANLEIARINLGYTVMKAPFQGRVDRHLVDVGNLVGTGEATLLSTIYRLDPMYAYFNINERDLVRLMLKDQQNSARDPSPTPVYLGIEGEKGYPHKGRLDFAATAVDTSTGTLLVRGIFDNPIKGHVPKMLPGMFVRIRIPVDTRDGVFFVTDRAIGVDQGGPYLLVVNAENVVEHRSVRMGPLVEGMRAVLEGLQKEDRVVVNGLQRARPGVKVTPVKPGTETGPSQARPGETAEKPDQPGTVTKTGPDSEPAAPKPESPPKS